MFKPNIGFSVGRDPAPFWGYLLLYFIESRYVKILFSLGSPRACKYHGTGRFIDGRCATEDVNELFKSFKNIYPKELELKCSIKEHIPLFLTLISLSKTIFLYISYFSSKEPSSIFYGSIYSEL